MIESVAASWPGKAERPNEDAYLCLDDLIIVADGATAPPSLGSGCIHGPRWYARQLVAQAAAAYTISARPALDDVLSLAIRNTAASHAHTCDITHPGSPSATVVMLARSSDAMRWLVLGDATLVTQTTGWDAQVTSDQRLSNTSKAERAAVLTGDSADGGHAERIAALSAAQRKHRNTPDGFWIAATDPDAAYHAYTGEQSVASGAGWRAALMTDGASAAIDTYGLTDWNGALDLLAKTGASHFLAMIRAAEAGDPDLKRYPRMKVSDDATVVYVTDSTEQASA